jgi:hypothetical protein
MTRTEKLVTAAVLVVNLSVGFVLIARSDDSGLAASGPLAPRSVAALSPMAAAPSVTFSEPSTVSQDDIVAEP